MIVLIIYYYTKILVINCCYFYIIFNFMYFRPIPMKNKGFKLLENMGWTPGKSLGASNSGIKEPVSVLLNKLIQLLKVI